MASFYSNLLRASLATVLGVATSRGELISLRDATMAASTSVAGYFPSGAGDGSRFSAEPGHAWQGGKGQGAWWWQCQFAAPRPIGAILQVIGDHGFVLRNAPLRYVWQWSPDGEHWHDLATTAVQHERRTFRIHRLRERPLALCVRLYVSAVAGPFPTLREVEFYSDADESIAFPEWILAVNTTDQPTVPSHGQEFIPLAKACPGWDQLQAQQIWLGDFNEDFVRAEPRPLAAFLSGNFKDWCEIAREPWRGVQEVLKNRRLPIWASCGGAQGLAIVAEVGVDRPWDCPHCRDPRAPKVPIYTHIGHTGTRPCGDYSACIFERGPHQVQRLIQDPVFDGLPDVFTVMESHCGQIEWPPKDWVLIATAGPDGKTRSQCLRVTGFPIYAAQFHIEMEGTPDVSRRIMGNFLGVARRWNQSPAGTP